MTLLFLAANDHEIYLVADSNTVDKEEKTFTTQTQKFFCSKKHNILVGFSDEGLLAGKTEATSYYVDHLLSQFVDYIEKMDNFSVKNLLDSLMKFIQSKYLTYPFFTQTKLFYAGFTAEGHPHIATVETETTSSGDIASITEVVTPLPADKKLSSCVWLSNMRSNIIKCYSALPETGKPKPLEALVGNEQTRQSLLTLLLPWVAHSVNSDNHPFCIGKQLFYTSITPKGESRKLTIEWDCNPNAFPTCKIKEGYAIEFETYPTLAESEKAFSQHQLKKFSLKSGKEIVPEAAAAAATADDASSSDKPTFRM